MLFSVLLACGLSLVNFLAQVLLIKYMLGISYFRDGGWSKFMKYLYSSILGRLVGVIVVFWLCIRFLNIDYRIFSIAFLISYFFLTLFEVFYINFRSNFLILQIQKSKEN